MHIRGEKNGHENLIGLEGLWYILNPAGAKCSYNHKFHVIWTLDSTYTKHLILAIIVKHKLNRNNYYTTKKL